ncbi:MAG: outer membrane beta-barrel protein [Rhizobiaceae bacterium]
MTTSRVRPIFPKYGISRIAIVLAAGLGCAAYITAIAQETTGLRGAIIQEDNAPRVLPGRVRLPSQRPRTAGAQFQLDATATGSSRYQPVSEGALPDDEADDELDGYVSTSSPAAATNDLTAARLPRRPQQADGETTDGGSQASSRNRTTTGIASDDSGETELTTGTVRAGTIDSADDERNVAAQVTAERTGAIEGLERGDDETPYAAPGIRVGTFILRPTLQQGIEWTSNAQSTAGGSSDFLSATSLNLEAVSDWSRHSASLSLDGAYRTSITGSGFSEFTGSADAKFGLDVGNDYRLNAGAGYSRGPEAATSPAVLTGTLGRALRQTLTANLGAEKHSGPLRAALTGDVSRNTYGAATLSTGGTVTQAERNNTLYSAKLRGGYEVSPSLVPFVELEYGRRIHDQRLDTSGYARSASIYGARAGLEFNRGDKLNGELSAGWITESLDDSRLASISALSLDADINWSPMRGTIVSLNAGTEIEGSTTAGSSGSVLYDASVAATRELRANLTGTASLGAGLRRYAASADRDFTLNGQLSLTWWMNRYAGITGRASHERISSNVAGRDSQTTTVYLGLTMRR